MVSGRTLYEAGQRKPSSVHPGMVLEHRLEPRVVVDQGLRRLGDLVVEVLRVHLEGQRLELRGDLLETQARPQRDLDERVLGRVEERGHEVVGDHVLAQQERAGLQLRFDAAVAREQDERARVAEEALALQAGRDRGRGVALLHDELDLGRVARGRLGHRRADVLAHDVVDERQLERRGVVGRPAEDRAVDQRPEGRDGDDQHDPGEDQREEQEPDEPAHAVAAAVRAAVAPSATAAARRLVLRQVRGRVGIRVVGMGLWAATIPRASAGADRHVLLSGVSTVARGMDERRPARVSSSSWRMIAAASRSTRAR